MAVAWYADMRYIVDRLIDFPDERLVGFALTRTGFGNSNLGSRVTYPDGDDDTAHIPLRCVEMRASYWVEPFIAAETEYLQVLAERFQRNSSFEAVSEVEGFLKLLPSLPAKAYMPIAELLDAILLAFPVDYIVTFSVSRRTFQIGKFGYGVRYFGEEYVPSFRENVHLCQYYGRGATLPEADYLMALHAALCDRDELKAAVKIDAFRKTSR